MLGAAVLALAGCGDDKDEPAANASGGAAKPLTKAQFIARADAICRDVKAAQQPYTDRIRALSRVDQLERLAPILEGAQEESRKGLQRLRALPAPEEDRATLDGYYAAAQKLLDAGAELAAAAKANDRARGRKVAASAGALSADEQRLADDYGLEDCNDVF